MELYKIENIEEHLALLNTSFESFIGKPFVIPKENESLLEAVNNANFGLLSHGNELDPIFNFANTKALTLFDYSFDEFTKLPSRLSAQVVSQEERNALLKQAQQFGFIKDYKGIRISSKGVLFEINDVILWNVIDANNKFCGQAALINAWKYC